MKRTCILFAIASFLFAVGCTSQTSTVDSSTDVDSTASTSAPDAGHADTAANDQVAASDDQARPLPEVDAAAGDDAAMVLPEGALSIGSKAPSLDIEHWISDGNGAFQAVTDFSADKVYVVEFWATWCGPCVQSMPHLVKIQEEFKDSVQVISVSNEDLETITGFLEKPYSAGGEDGPQTYGELTSSYCLTTDPDRSVGKDYMEAAGQNGIPACFVVGKTGQIEWIGHPMALDEPLSQVVEGSWDRDAYAKEFQKEQMFGIMMSQIFEAAQGGDIEKANELIEKARSVAGPNELRQLESIAMQIKMAPIAKMMQSGDTDGAIAAIEALMATVEGPMKEQLGTVLDQIKQMAANASEAAEEENEVVEPAAE